MRQKYGNILLYFAAAVLMGVGIHLTQEYRFYNIAVNDLFIYDWADIWAKLCRTGGFATLTASFLTQFFHIPFAGTVIVTVLYLLAARIFACIGKKLAANGGIACGSGFIPVIFLFLCLDNDYYRFQGHTGYIIVLAAVYAYISLPSDRPKLRYAAGILSIPLLYHLSGSVTAVYAICIFICEVIRNGLKGLPALIYPVVLALTAFINVEYSMVDSWEHALTPFMYYSWPSTYNFPFTAWVLAPVVMILVWKTSGFKMSERVNVWIASAGFVAAFAISGYLYSQVHSRSYYRLIQEQHWASEGDWDRIIETADRRQPNYLISYLNLALAQKGQLVEKLGYYNPQPVSKVMFPTQNLKTGLTLQSTVYLAWGYVSAARQAAFDADMVTPGMHNPQQLKVLVLTNLALDAPEVAEKYLGILDKTLFHRAWSGNMRRLMADPAAAEKDETLARLRRSLPQTGGYVRYEGLKGDMRDIAAADPSNTILAQFYTAYQMLETLEER